MDYGLGNSIISMLDFPIMIIDLRLCLFLANWQ